jgi:hypothetical protein
MEKILILGDGSLIHGIVILPFAINGLLLVIKGAIAYLEKVDQKYTFKKNWQVGAFGVISLLSYLGFIYAVTKLL